MYQNDAQKVLTGEVRLSYANLIVPRPPQQGGDPKYSVTLLIPKTDTATKADIDNAIAAAAQASVSTVWGGYRPQFKTIIHDGDGVRQDGKPYGDECKGHWVITASSKNKPQVVMIGADGTLVDVDPRDIYSGMYARVTIRFYGFNTAGNKGIGCGLGNVLKTRDGESLSGGASAATDFAGLASAVGVTPQQMTQPIPPQQYGYTAAPAMPVPQAMAAPQAMPPQQYGYAPMAAAPAIDPVTGLPVNNG